MFGSAGAFGRVLMHRPQHAALVVAMVAVVVRWYRSLREEIRLHRSHEKVHPILEKWKKKSSVLKEGYTPPVLLSLGSRYVVGTINTLIHNIFRRLKPVPDVNYDRELFRLKDGGTVGIDWATERGEPLSEHKGNPTPIVLIHHGLAGCSRSHYVQSIIHKLLALHNVRVCVMVARGCGGVKLTTPYHFTANGYNDLGEVIDYLKENNPEAPIYGIGYSLGAGLMANYLGRTGENCKLSAAVVCSASWDFSKHTSLTEVWSRKFLATSLKEYFEANKDVITKNPAINYDKCMEAVNAREFDEHAIVPTFGFKCVDDYYKDASATFHAHQVHVPTLSFNADDDPVCSSEGAAIMADEKRIGPGLVVARTHRGGHVSWAEGFLGYDSFMDRVILEWLEACREHVEGKEVSCP
mmetsp:Transcript_15555/g.27630  ORF Transcript_15555/g.27630 Transcript_15555/m.27630 type:complete len:410 (-) Transcript_15555:169-1398(-)